MSIIVTGRTGSGKTIVSSLNKNFIELDIRKFVFVESDIKYFQTFYKEGTKILVIDTPAILCLLRKNIMKPLSYFDKEDKILKYVTELPNCTIIKNDESLDDLRFKVKKFIETL